MSSIARSSFDMCPVKYISISKNGVDHIDFNAFIHEYTKIFIANYKRVGYELFFFNHVDLSNDDTLEVMDAISKLVRSDIIILCFSLIK